MLWRRDFLCLTGLAACGTTITPGSRTDAGIEDGSADRVITARNQSAVEVDFADGGPGDAGINAAVQDAGIDATTQDAAIRDGGIDAAPEDASSPDAGPPRTVDILRSVPGLLSWYDPLNYDAERGILPDAGPAGNDLHQASEARRPARTTRRDGRPALRFSAAQRQCLATETFSGVGENGSVFCVAGFQTDAMENQGVFDLSSTGATNTGVQLFAESSGGTTNFIFRVGPRPLQDLRHPFSNGLQHAFGYHDPLERSAWSDVPWQSHVAPKTLPECSHLRLGGLFTETYYFDGDLLYIAFYDGPLSIPEALRVHDAVTSHREPL